MFQLQGLYSTNTVNGKQLKWREAKLSIEMVIRWALGMNYRDVGP